MAPWYGDRVLPQKLGASPIHWPLFPVSSDSPRRSSSCPVCPQLLAQCPEHSRKSVNAPSGTLYFISEELEVK